MKKHHKMSSPLTCVNEVCSRSGIQVYSNQENCTDCGQEMLPFDQYMQLLSEELAREERNGLNSSGLNSSTTFTCPPDLTGCPIALRADVHVPIELYNQWVFLCRRIATEWIAYLKGTYVEAKNSYHIDSMYFPRQSANKMSVEAEEGQIQDGTIGAVHSHVDMQVFFSEEDKKHMNHTVEMVVNSKGDIIANGRTKLECGRWHRGDARVVLSGCSENMNLVERLQSLITPTVSMEVQNGSLVNQVPRPPLQLIANSNAKK